MVKASRTILLSSILYLLILSTGDAKTLEQELNEFKKMHLGEKTPFEQAEKKCNELLEKYTEPEEQARIYYQVAVVYSQCGQIKPEKTIEFSKKALELPLDPIERLKLYIWWGDAIQIANGGVRGQDLVIARRKAVIPYLNGLKESLSLQYPEYTQSENLPEEQKTKTNSPDPLGSFRQRRRAEQRMALYEWKKDRFEKQLNKHKRVLTDQISYMYSRFPLASDEIRELATKILEDETAVGILMSAVDEAVEKRVRKTKDRPTVTNTKTIHFPEDRSVGTLSLDGKKRGRAQGTIEIPSGAIVELEIGEVVTDISFLESFAANDIQHLNLARARRRIADADLVYIKGLTELKSLRLGGERFTDAGLAHIRDLRYLTTLSLWYCNITDKGLQFLSDMTSMQSLNLGGTKISDAGLMHLKEMESLRSLNLSYASITGEGLVYLKNMTSLTKLNLGETRINDQALANLKGMKSLKEISFRGSSINDSGLVHLKDLTSLEVLDLSRTSLTGSGLVHLRNLESLQTLRLGQTRFQDKYLVHLKFLPSLRNLNLERTPITDNAIEHLKHLTSLDEVRIAETRISQAAAKKLQEELPPFSKANASRAMVNWALPAYLTQKQVAKLAATIANNEFERLYNKRPFKPPKYSKENENSRWDGGQVKLTGKDKCYAEVWLNKEGRDQKVHVYSNKK